MAGTFIDKPNITDFTNSNHDHSNAAGGGTITNVTGNAATATKLATARAINGQNFDGTSAITVPVNNTDDHTTNATMYPIWAATQGGNYAAFSSNNLTWNPSTATLTATNFAGKASTVNNATFTTALTVNGGTLTLTANAANTSVLTIGAGAVSVSGSNTGDQTNISGNAATATKLAATKMINGVAFDGSADIANVFPEGFLVNGKIVPSVASNNLTVALKTLAGTDPSATDPVYVRIAGVVRSITAALSVTKNAGTNWCNAGGAELATQDVDFFAYLGYNATDGVVIGFSRVPTAQYYSDFSTTSTANRYAAISTITHAASTDVYENIGRFNATLSATASFNWSIPATAIVINHPIIYTRWLTWAISVTPNTGTYSFGTDFGTKYCIQGNTLKIRVARGQGTITGSPVNLQYNLVMDAIFTTSELPGFSAGRVWDGAGANIAPLTSSILSATTSKIYYSTAAVWPNSYYFTLAVDIPI